MCVGKRVGIFGRSSDGIAELETFLHYAFQMQVVSEAVIRSGTNLLHFGREPVKNVDQLITKELVLTHSLSNRRNDSVGRRE